MSTLSHATCPTCAMPVLQRKNGTLRRHRLRPGERDCDGSGAYVAPPRRTVDEVVGEMVEEAMRTGGFVRCEHCAGTGWAER